MSTKINTNKKVFNLIIIDESGSMSVIQKETLAGINETIITCQKMQETHPEIEQRITLVTFDSNHFNIHYDNINAQEASPLKVNQYSPCGATPLYDAIGRGIAKINAQTEVDSHVLVTIITDGEENCSKEYNLKMVKNLIDKQKKLGWTFSLIGTDNLDVEGMANSMSIDNCLKFTEDEASTMQMFKDELACRKKYNNCIAMNIDMSVGSYFDPKNE